MMMEGSGNRIALVIVTIAIVLMSIIFAIPFIDVSYQVTETYYDTETNEESYVETVSNVSLETCEKEEMVYDDTPYSVPLGISVPFLINRVNARLVGSFRLPASGGFYLYSSTGKIIYEKLGEQGVVDIPLSEGEYTALLRERLSWEGKVYLSLKIKWTELCETTKYREVTKYRNVPVLVEKQRIVTNYRKSSFWEMIFSK